MSTTIRPEISQKNKYWISKQRYYELKHYCLQYPEWKKLYSMLENKSLPKGACLEQVSIRTGISNPTSDIAVLKAEYSKKIDMLENIAEATDAELASYILKAVTESASFTYLQTVMNIPCCKDTFYDRYRKFFWLLSSVRG